mmetsp:Transcript_9076/g.22270  ORF Transcript_9076/g.22270 Transcript_9076/m.22270 type:complete len:211 (-) Transcript_9076:3237-3869(-)
MANTAIAMRHGGRKLMKSQSRFAHQYPMTETPEMICRCFDFDCRSMTTKPTTEAGMNANAMATTIDTSPSLSVCCCFVSGQALTFKPMSKPSPCVFRPRATFQVFRKAAVPYVAVVFTKMELFAKSGKAVSPGEVPGGVSTRYAPYLVCLNRSHVQSRKRDISLTDETGSDELNAQAESWTSVPCGVVAFRSTAELGLRIERRTSTESAL